MELPRNRFKEALAKGGPLYGLWLGLPDSSVAELAGGAGFDWLLIDHEHGPFELRDVMHHLQALAPYPVAPIVRPVEGNPALLKKMLDIGVQTFLIPMVETAEQARELVSAALYPPTGTRGLGTSMARAAQWNRVPGYLKKANDEICLLLQVETASAMENIDAILAVEGVDGVFIGPSDLSASMGHIGDAGHPEVREAIAKGLASIKAANKIAGLLCMDPALVEEYVA
ncbi:MAG: aldolase/citrate lyase family protein, partial [Halieaceae bacterium]